MCCPECVHMCVSQSIWMNITINVLHLMENEEYLVICRTEFMFEYLILARKICKITHSECTAL